MARSFDGVDDFIGGSSSPETGVPLTIAAWLYPTTTTINLSAVAAYTASDGSAAWIGITGSTGQVRAGIRTGGGAFGIALSSISATANAWNHFCGVFASNTSRSSYLNGGNKGTNTTNRALSTLDRLTIGARGTSSGETEFFPGLIAEVGIWEIALADDDVARLALGFSPRLIRPQSLVFYAPLIRDVQDIRGGLSLTTTGTTVADHPRIYA